MDLVVNPAETLFQGFVRSLKHATHPMMVAIVPIAIGQFLSQQILTVPMLVPAPV
jgi:hypothetical protein